MLGALTTDQIENVLRSEIIGRIGCYSQHELYVVPVTYAFHEGCIYAHSQEGRKILMMRENPHVCFQVDAMDDMTNWRSVLVWGDYQELKSEEERKAAMKILVDRLAPFVISATVHPTHGHPPEAVEKAKKSVVFKIIVRRSSGRFEKSDRKDD